MKLAISILTLSLTSAVMAELTPGYVVTSGAPFPIVADFNGDGLDDLIQERNVVLNDGTSLAEVRDLGLAGERVVGVLDANGDGRLDLLTEGSAVMVPAPLPQPPRQGPGYRLYMADESRNFPNGIGISTGVRPYIADVDADGKDDFVLLTDVRPDGFRTTATEVTVLRSRGDGTFDRLEPFSIVPGFQIYPSHRVLSGDLNHDGLPDLVIRCVNDLVVLLGTGGGRFAVRTRHLPTNPSFGSQSARLGDVDGDSHPDVVLQALRGIRVFFGDGRGNFP
ncbi:MAG TPA: VCBS repeat-containing protein, partial [Thermoanaerobaculia bacterium]|nr:VCBS repeat-containing protein [Thermoanaerobaculia bacterium]